MSEQLDVRAPDALIDHLPDVVLRYDASGRLVYANDRLAAEIDTGGCSMIGYRPTEHVPPGMEGVELYQAQLMRVLATGEPGGARLGVRSRAGERRTMWMRFRAERDALGTIVGVVAVGRDVTEQLLAQDELVRGEREFRALADDLPDVVLRYDVDGRVTYTNTHWGESLGRDPSTVLGKRPTESAQPGTIGVEEYEACLMRVLATGEPGSVELQIEGAGGDRLTHSVLVRAQRNQDGAIVGAVAIGRDITELGRLQAETARRELELRTLAENLPDVVIRYDADGRASYINRSLVDGHPADDSVIGRRPTEHDVPGLDGIEEYERVLLEVLATGEPASALLRHTDAHGRLAVLSTLFRAERDGDGVVVGAIAINRDITDLQHAHGEIARREQEYRTLAENLPDAVVRYDVDGRITYMNEMLKSSLPVLPDGYVGKRPTEIPLPGDADLTEFEQQLMHVLATGRPAVVEVRDTQADGQVVVMSNLLGAERDESGEIVGAIAIGRDITQLERAKAEIARREEELRTLADTLPDVVLRYDAEGRATYMNRVWSATLGRDPSMVLHKRPTEVAHPDTQGVEEYEQRLMEVIASGGSGSAELRVVDVHGDLRTHAVLFRAQRDGDGRIVGAVAIGRDVTALEQARAENAQLANEYRSLAEHLPDVVVRYDRAGRVVYTNHRLAELVDIDEDPHGTRPSEHRLPGVLDVDEYERVLLGVIETGEPATREVRQMLPNGELLRHHVLIHAERDHAGEIIGAIAIGRDVTELVNARQRAADREREFRTLAENATEFIARWDTDGVRVYVNPALARLHGMLPGELVGLASDGLGERSSAVGPAIEAVIRERVPQTVQQVLVDPATGRSMVHDVRLVPEFGPEGELVSVLGVGRDVTDVVRQRDELERAASTDLLTGVASRGVLYERLPEMLVERAADGAIGALILLDLDGFKAINDHFGHQVGDRILQEVARRLAHGAGADDLIVRLGGDEFVLVLPRIDSPADASLRAYQARTQLTSLSDIDGTRVPALDVCMGVAFFPSDGDDVDELLSHADLALYEAKGRGRGHVEYFRRDLRSAMERRTMIERSLLQCDPDREMSLHLQPICRLGPDSSVWGVEALLRWEHPRLGSIRPDEFIPIAEQSGDIIRLGRWVLRQTAELAAELNRGRVVPLRFAVNVSSRQVTLGDVEDAVADAVAATGCDPSWLTLELTERLLLEDLPQVTRSLEALHDLGVSLAIDDFGTGYSALQYLTRLDIDQVKIDRSFLRGSDDDVQHREVVRAIVAMADALGVDLVAEGIESTSQVEFLRSLGCDLGQGFLLARPMPATDLAAWLSEAEPTLRSVLR